MPPRKNQAKPANKVIWRISANAPLGEYVHEETGHKPHHAPVAVPEPASPEVRERGWHHSSHELVHGVDMSEAPLDGLPDDLFDLFFKKVE